MCNNVRSQRLHTFIERSEIGKSRKTIVHTASSLQLFRAGRFIITVRSFSFISNTRNIAVFVFTLFAMTRVHLGSVNASERFVLHARQLLRITVLYRVRAATACTTSCTLAWSTILTLYPDSPFWTLPSEWSKILHFARRILKRPARHVRSSLHTCSVFMRFGRKRFSENWLKNSAHWVTILKFNLIKLL